MRNAQAEKMACRMLLIEDDRDDAFLFQRAVACARHHLDVDIELRQADDGLAALDLVSQQNLEGCLPHAIILDLDMPRFGGIEFLHALRRNLQLKDVPVIVLTDTSAPPVHEEAILAGANRVFVKPTDGGALVRFALEIVTQHCPVKAESDEGSTG